jgi:hypothetical protein
MQWLHCEAGQSEGERAWWQRMQVKSEGAARQELSVWQSRWPRPTGRKGEWSGEKGRRRECAAARGKSEGCEALEYVPEIE